MATDGDRSVARPATLAATLPPERPPERPTTLPPERPTTLPPELAASPRPGVLWWLLAISSFGVGGYALTLQDARAVQNAVPGMPWIDELHFAAGGLALLIGPLAFRRDILMRRRSLHRRIGWLYAWSVAVSGLAACLMAPFSMAGLWTHLGFGVLALLWLGTTAMGIRAIHRRNVRSHRRWMVQSFALCFAAVTLRIQLGPLAMTFGSFEIGYRIVSWSCWVPNLLFAWWWLARPRYRIAAG